MQARGIETGNVLGVFLDLFVHLWPIGSAAVDQQVMRAVVSLAAATSKPLVCDQRPSYTTWHTTFAVGAVSH